MSKYKIFEKINTFLGYVGIDNVSSKVIAKLRSDEELIAQWLMEISDHDFRFRTVSSVIFSKDRPLQLHALLCSMNAQFLEYPNTVHIIYQVSDQSYKDAYAELKDEVNSNQLRWCFQGSRTFKSCLVEIIEKIDDELLLFLVDDIIFTEQIKLSEWSMWPPTQYVASLRLGKQLKRCFNKNLAIMPLPKLVASREFHEFFEWEWKSGKYDWAYPLSVDGHFFNVKEIKLLAKWLEYKSPNTFESELQRYVKVFSERKGVCMKTSRLVNVPANVVQNDIKNIHGNLTAEQALKYWKQGKRIQVENLYGMEIESVHQLVNYHFS